MNIITISTTNKQPREDAEKWSFDISELGHILRNTCEGGHYEYYDGRLYEAEPIERPFWQVEQEYKARKGAIRNICKSATTLKEALETGVNSVRLVVSSGDELYVGYMDEGGEFELSSLYEYANLDNIKVEFCGLERDSDGYTIAIYKEAE